MRWTTVITPVFRLPVAVPDTAFERARGVNGGLPPGMSGMLFNFDPPGKPVMTMEQTPFQLQIAFIGPDRVVHSTFLAPPRSGRYTTDRPTRWVLETPWAIVRAGDRVRFA